MNVYKMTDQINMGLINKAFTILNICLGMSAFAQNVGDPHQYNQLEINFPQSPTVANFQKYVNIPQANYTGVHGYSVPIYTISGQSFSFPISIDYHGMGVNINEIASPVGLGWNLNLGGVNFSQEVRGYDDFTSTHITNLNSPMDFYSTETSPGGAQYENAIKIAGGYSTVYHGSSSGSDQYEINPDYFNYSLLNNNGRFIKDKLWVFHTVPKDDIDIARSGNTLILIDSNGIKYYFSRYLHSTSQSQLFRVDKTYQWKLDSIFFPEANETMSFNYIETNYQYESNKQHSVNLYTSIQDISSNTPHISQPVTSTTNTVVEKEYLIESITFKNTKVEFIYSDGRVETNGGKKLNNVKVKYRPQAGVEQTIKDYQIGNSNFNARLRLNTFTELLSNTSYRFDYEDSKSLPQRFSPAADWWGSYTKPTEESDRFFNYSQSPSYLRIDNLHLPSFIYKQNINSVRKYFIGANKEPDIEFAKTGSLKRVHLPTGGFQEFHYELDDYKFHSSDIEYKHFYLNTDAYINTSPSTNVFNIRISSSGDPNIPDYPDYRKGLDYKLTFATNYENCGYVPGNHGSTPIGRYYRFQLYNQTTNQIIKEQIIDRHAIIQLEEFDSQSSYYIKILEFSGGGCESQPAEIRITPQINWIHESEPIYKKNKNAGHLRVKAITLHDATGDTLIKKRFEYKNFTDSSFSSGIFSGIPYYTKLSFNKYHHQKPNPTNPNCPIMYMGAFDQISSNPALNLNSSYGKSVFYENVTEIYENLKDASQSYRKEFVFQVPNQDGYPEYRDPVIYWPHNEYTGGQLLEERSFDYLGRLVKKIKNEYSSPDPYFNSQSSYYDDGPGMSGYIGFGLAAAVDGYTDNGPPPFHPGCYGYEHKTNYYLITSGWIKHLSTTQEDYNNGSLIMSNKTEYQYSPTYSTLNPISVTNTNSRNEELKTEYVYGHPYKKDEPTTVRTYENGTAVSVQQTTFQAAGLPQYVFAKKGASTLDNVPPSEDLKVTYNSYDANHNLEQYTLENGTPVSIIWGYNGQYPIAKVEGKTYTEIEHLANLLIADSNATYGLQPDFFNNLRNIEGALVTSYIYKPLVGVTTVIQPNGQTEYYTYDPAGRLEEVYIMEVVNNVPVKRVLKKNKYNYQP